MDLFRGTRKSALKSSLSFSLATTKTSWPRPFISPMNRLKKWASAGCPMPTNIFNTSPAVIPRHSGPRSGIQSKRIHQLPLFFFKLPKPPEVFLLPGRVCHYSFFVYLSVSIELPATVQYQVSLKVPIADVLVLLKALPPAAAGTKPISNSGI